LGLQWAKTSMIFGIVLDEANIRAYRMLVKTMDYLDHFARFKRKENVEAVERLLSAHQELAKFERAQLGMTLSLHTEKSYAGGQ